MKPKLYPQIYDWTNLLAAHRQAARGKRGREPAAAFEYRLEDNLMALHEELRDKTYQPGAYNSFYIHEPKRRLISAAPFRDRVAHHALCNIIEPIFEKSFIHHSYANRAGKGTHRALAQAQRYARRFRYVLSCDVRQYFPSIDHQILREILVRKIPDRDVMWLVDRILESGIGVLSEVYDMVYFRGDDLFAINRARGLPIGNLTSQFWANCYLNGFDHFAKRELRCAGYIRFVDDMLFFADEKETLWEWKRAVVERLASLRLTLHKGSAQAHRTADGFPFLGFVTYPHKRRLKRRKGIHFARRFRKLAMECAMGVIALDTVTESVRGWVNHAAFGDTRGLRRAILCGTRLTLPRPCRPRPRMKRNGPDADLYQNI